MKKLFGYADTYVKRSDWKDLAMIKFCLAAIGLLIGLQIPREKKKPVTIAAGLVFIVTYVPLMAKFFRIILEKGTEEEV